MSRKQIFEILAPPIAFQRCLVPIAGSVNAALMLSQAIYWTPRTSDPDGWFYKSQKDWESETRQTRSEQEIARKQLRTTGFWQERLRGVPATLYFCVDCEILQTRLLNFNILVCEKPQTRLQKPANKIADSSKLSQRLPETTAKTTAEEAAAAFKEIGFDQPFGHLNFQAIFLDEWLNPKGRWMTQIMEAAIQRCLHDRVGVPPQFYEAKRDIEMRENAQVRKRAPL